MKFRNGRNDKPELDHYDEPIKYVVRFSGDDPRSGWVDIALMTAQEIIDCDYPDYYEWLDTTPQISQSVEERPENSKEIIAICSEWRQMGKLLAQITGVGFFSSVDQFREAWEEIENKKVSSTPDVSIEQDFKEINHYLDDLYEQMVNKEKDGGNLWIQFIDKFNAFKKKISSVYYINISIVDKLRGACPFDNNTRPLDGFWITWNQCCDKLKELISTPDKGESQDELWKEFFKEINVVISDDSLLRLARRQQFLDRYHLTKKQVNTNQP